MLALGAAVLLGLSLLATAWIDTSREARSIDPLAVATGAFETSRSSGAGAPEVRRSLLDLRQHVGARPLDAWTRALYAELVLAVTPSMDGVRVATFHARYAAATAPVTVPVVRRAARVLTGAGRSAEALALTRRMFEYDPEPAARLLADLRIFLLEDDLSVGLADQPEAWFAWSRELRNRGDLVEADRWSEETLKRWPEHLATRRRVVEIVLARGDWPRVSDLLTEADLTESSPDAAILLAIRARTLARRGDRTGAAEDIAASLSWTDNEALVLSHAGDVDATFGDVDGARARWHRALFMLRGDRSPLLRKHVLTRLARLEDEHGSASAALRHWRAVLETDPDHAEAQRRIDDLTGFNR